MQYSRAFGRSRQLSVLRIAVLATLAWTTTASAQSPDAQLGELARQAVEAHNDVLVTGNIDQALRGKERAEAIRGALQEHLPVLENRRKALGDRGIRYTSHRTQLTLEEGKVDGSTATQRGVERVALTLDPSVGGPTETEYEQVHVFRYAKEGDSWRLVSDTIEPPPPLPEEIPAPADAAPLRQAPPGYRPDPSRRQPPAAGQPSQAVWSSQGAIAPAVLVGPAGDLRFAATAYYNITNAVNYALTYWDNYNTAYREYPNDCTNFTSQAFRAGGWPFDETGGRTDPDTWYYGSFTWTTSYSWAGAHNFYLFFRQSGRGFMAQYFSDLIRGDLVQADFGPTPDGNISHSMLVTHVDSNNNAYVTYHTNDTKNRPLQDLLATNPGTRWYGLLMYGSFTY